MAKLLRLKLIDGPHADEYFVSGDFEGYKTTPNAKKAPAFGVEDWYGNACAMLDMHRVHCLPEWTESGEEDG